MPVARGGFSVRAVSAFRIVIGVAVVVFAFAGCGSSKPAYCSARSDLETSVKDLGNVSLSSGGVDALKSQLQKVKSNADSVVSSAKKDFPTETSAISSSVSALETAVKALPANPSVTQLAPIASDVSNVGTAAKSFTDATSSKCS
jgi:hypothetical protein